MQVGVPAARDRYRAELLRGRAVLQHVSPHDRGEVHGLGKEAERHLEVLLQRLRRVRLPGTARHRTTLRRPRHGEHVEDVRRLPGLDGLRRQVRRRARPRHAAAPLRGPQVVAGAEVLVERGGIEVGEGPVPGQTVDV